MKKAGSAGLALICAVISITACQDRAALMGRGFRLPEGDVERGKTAFIELNCHHCHTVAGLELPKPEIPAGVSFELGGVVRTVKSYGQLVTAITQPQHIVSADYLARIEKARRDGTASPMPSFNEQMTVSQLTDIVTFLHSHYRKAPPPGMNYPQYMP